LELLDDGHALTLVIAVCDDEVDVAVRTSSPTTSTL
jgi:hypothetical protein